MLAIDILKSRLTKPHVKKFDLKYLFNLNDQNIIISNNTRIVKN